MARTDLTKTTALRAYGTYSANAADLTMTAVTNRNQFTAAGNELRICWYLQPPSSKNQFTAAGNELVIAHNTGASAATVTITSVADPCGRASDIATYSLDAGEYVVFGFKPDSWQPDGNIYLEASSADVKFGVIALCERKEI